MQRGVAAATYSRISASAACVLAPSRLVCIGTTHRAKSSTVWYHPACGRVEDEDEASQQRVSG